MQFSSIDIFCHVIDNFGDAGVTYRFAREFKAAHPRWRVRLFIDALSALQALDAGIDAAKRLQSVGGVDYIDSSRLDAALVAQLDTAEVLVEAFGCDIPAPVIARASTRPTLIVNLEYLSAESWVAGYHLKPSPQNEPNLRKVFFMPGFTPDTGGVIIDPRLERRRAECFGQRHSLLTELLTRHGITPREAQPALYGTVFTYLRPFDALLRDLAQAGRRTYLLVFGEKSQQGMMRTLERLSGRRLSPCHWTTADTHVVLLPFLPQAEYDRLLGLADFNLVRGEDSLVRAILAGRPFLWQAYLQEQKYQTVKVTALLQWQRTFFDDPALFERYRQLSLRFNDLEAESATTQTEESFAHFLQDSEKIAHAAAQMSYFIRNNCNLIEKFTEFLKSESCHDGRQSRQPATRRPDQTNNQQTN